MQTHQLVPHPDHPPLAVRAIEARVIARDAQWLRLRWKIEGAGQLHVPAFAGKGRADELWRTTCFELFLRPVGGTAYCEFNLSPSERWSAYDFTSYRDGMTDRPMPREPACSLRRGSWMTMFDGAIPAEAVPEAPCDMALAAIIEEDGGRLSYWAIAHRDGPPDFHDATCFAGALAAPEEA